MLPFYHFFSPRLPQFGRLTERNKKKIIKRPPKETFLLPQIIPDEILSTRKMQTCKRDREMQGGWSFISYQVFNPSINFCYTTTLEAIKSNLVIELPKNPLLLCHSHQSEACGGPGCKQEQRCQWLQSSTICVSIASHRTHLSRHKKPKNPVLMAHMTYTWLQNGQQKTMEMSNGALEFIQGNLICFE